MLLRDAPACLCLLLALAPAAASEGTHAPPTVSVVLLDLPQGSAALSAALSALAAEDARAEPGRALPPLTPAAEAPGTQPAGPEPRTLDVRLFHLVNLRPGRQDAADPYFRAVMPLGEKAAAAIPAGLYAAGLIGQDTDLREAGVLSAAAMVSSVIAVEGLKGIIGRPRPVERLGDESVRVVGTRAADGLSFPSGHTATAFSWATVLSDLYPEGAILFYGTATSVGVGRVRLGAHYPSDVLAGALLGYLSGRLVMSNRGFIMRKGTPGQGVDTTGISRTFRF